MLEEIYKNWSNSSTVNLFAPDLKDYEYFVNYIKKMFDSLGRLVRKNEWKYQAELYISTEWKKKVSDTERKEILSAHGTIYSDRPSVLKKIKMWIKEYWQDHELGDQSNVFFLHVFDRGWLDASRDNSGGQVTYIHKCSGLKFDKDWPFIGNEYNAPTKVIFRKMPGGLKNIFPDEKYVYLAAYPFSRRADAVIKRIYKKAEKNEEENIFLVTKSFLEKISGEKNMEQVYDEIINNPLIVESGGIMKNLPWVEGMEENESGYLFTINKRIRFFARKSETEFTQSKSKRIPKQYREKIMK